MLPVPPSTIPAPKSLELPLYDLLNHVLTHLNDIQALALIKQIGDVIPFTTFSYYGQVFATAEDFRKRHGVYPDAQYILGCFEGIFKPSPVEAFSDDFAHDLLERLMADKFRNRAAEALAKSDYQALESVVLNRARTEGLAEPVLCCEAPPMPDPVYAGGLYSKHLNLIIGESGISKSSFAIALGVGCALGREVIPGWVPNRQGRVLYLSGEDDRSVLKCKYGAIESVYSLPGGTMDELERSGALQTIDEATPLLSYLREGGYHNTSAGWGLLRRAVQERYAMIIIDPLSHWSGITDENPTGQMGEFAQWLTRLARESGSAVALVHHASKNGSQGKPDQHSARGSSALAAAARFIVGLAPLDPMAYRHPDDHAEHHVSLYHVKNSYRKRAPREEFHQGAWGFLEKSNLRDVLLLRLGQEIERYVQGLEKRPTRRELESAVVDPTFIKMATKTLGGKQHSIKPVDLRDALQRLWDNGHLEIQANRTGSRGKPRQEVHVVVKEDEDPMGNSDAFSEYRIPDSHPDPQFATHLLAGGDTSRN